MRCVAKYIIVTEQPYGRVVGWCKHRRKRIAKRWGSALIMRRADITWPPGTIVSLRNLCSHGVEITDRCERQIARFLRRSGMTITLAR